VSQGRYPVLWIGQVAVVTLPAEIDVTIADTVRDELLAILSQGATLLIADLSSTEFCDSAGVSSLVRTYRQASTSGSAMRLVVSTPSVQRVLSITGVDRLVDVFPSVAASLAAFLTMTGAAAAPPAPAWPWLALTGALTLAFLAGNLSLQYGAARLPANRTAVVMLTEVVFASLSAVALGGGTLTARLAVGGAFIVAGALLAAREPAR